MPGVWLLPGDPARVDLALALLDKPVLVGQRREYRMAVGEFDGTPIGICSTGIGGPSAEIAVVELARLGARTVIRIGGMGAFSARLTPGSIGIVAGTTRESSAAAFYLSGECWADPRLVERLLGAGAVSGRDCLTIRVASVDGYYVGQGRPVPGFEAAAHERLLALRGSGIDGVDMEAETVIGVASSLGLSAGAVLGVHGSRVTDDWYEDYEPLQRDVVLTALRAASRGGRAADPRTG